MKIFMMISSSTSLFYMNSSHPVLLMALILLQTTIVCLVAWIKLKISWFSYILFLIFLGGLMVLFVYITSLASNEMIKLDSWTSSMLMMIILALTVGLLHNMNFQFLAEAPSNTFKTFYFMYNWGPMMIIILTMVYLLLTLIIVVKISNKFDAPIKNLIFN